MSKNGDCEHDIEADKEPTGFICKICIQKFEEKDLVILTKEREQLMQDVIAIAKNIREGREKGECIHSIMYRWDGTWFSCPDCLRVCL